MITITIILFIWLVISIYRIVKNEDIHPIDWAGCMLGGTWTVVVVFGWIILKLP